MTSMEIAITCLWSLAAAGLAWYCAEIGSQVTYVTLADGRRQTRSIPLLFRLLLPLAPNVTPLFRKPLFRIFIPRTQAKLVSAGFEGLLAAEDLLAMRLLLPLLLGPLWILFMAGMVSMKPDSFIGRIAWLVYLIGPFWLFMYPSFWLQRMLTARHRAIQRSLPFVLDLLTLSVEAGMDFMSALQRHVERGKVDELGEELVRVVREIQLGKTRRIALREMSVRVNLQDLRSVINALVQADELGVSIGSILRIQADQIRLRRFSRAEKLAHEAPVKMLGPLLLFIFPSVFLILLGPVLARLLQQGL